MKHGRSRFDFYLDQLDVLMIKAAAQPDPARWLYQNNARTPLFMAEGLAKLYSKLHNKKEFEWMAIEFKFIEDMIGAIDYYDAFAAAFAKDPTIAAEVTNYSCAKADEKAALLNKELIAKGWIGPAASVIEKIRKTLNDIDWKKPGAETKAIEKFYKKNIQKIEEFWSAFGSGFTEVETQVHSLRRKLRWLSIYPQALRGCIQLTDAFPRDPDLQKYLTPNIVESPFNKMPDADGNRHFMLLNRGYFLALSWMIAELGRLKDEGLRAALIAEATSKTSSKSLQRAKIAKPTLGRREVLGRILTESWTICNTFFNEHNLDKLVAGRVRSSV